MVVGTVAAVTSAAAAIGGSIAGMVQAKRAANAAQGPTAAQKGLLSVSDCRF